MKSHRWGEEQTKHSTSPFWPVSTSLSRHSLKSSQETQVTGWQPSHHKIRKERRYSFIDECKGLNVTEHLLRSCLSRQSPSSHSSNHHSNYLTDEETETKKVNCPI